MKKPALLVLGAILALVLVLGVYRIVQSLPEPPVENPPVESFTPTPSSPVTLSDRLDPAAYPAGTPVGDWLAGCTSPDRDEQLNSYILAHAAEAGDRTTYTYLICYRHGGNGLTATAALSEGDSGSRRLDVTYTAGGGRAEVALTYLRITLPAGKEPRVRLLDTTLPAEDGQTVGALMTVTEEEVSLPGQ